MDKTVIMNNRIKENDIGFYITGISWERIHLSAEVEVKNGKITESDLPDFYVVTHYYTCNAKFDVERVDDEHLILKLNVSNPGYNMCLPTGRYSVYACRGNDIIARVAVSGEFAPDIASASKTFIHNGPYGAYTVDFILDETDEGMYPLIRVLDAKQQGLPMFSFNPENAPKPFSVKLKKKIEERIIKPKKRIGQIYGSMAKRYSNKNGRKNVLIMSEQNEKMGANLLAVYKRIQERHIEDKIELDTSFRSMVADKDNFGVSSWYHTLKKMAKADVILVDDHCPVLDWLTLDEKTTLVQLWHAGAGYKGVGYSRWGHEGCPAPVCCHRQYDYCMTPGRNISHFFSEQFGINDEQVIPTGMPRMDEYLNEEYKASKIKELREKYPVVNERKVILFAPTYRGKDKSDAHYPYEIIDFKKLYDVCGDEYAVFFKMHPWVSGNVPFPEEYSDRFFDLSDYPNINDLFYITELFISDYSSGVFEYSLMRKPALFFAFDEIQYSYTRGFHRDYRSGVPGKVCSTFDELITAIENKDFEFEKNESYVDYHFDYYDTNSCDRVIDWFLLDKMPEEFTERIRRKKEETDKLLTLDFSSILLK